MKDDKEWRVWTEGTDGLWFPISVPFTSRQEAMMWGTKLSRSFNVHKLSRSFNVHHVRSDDPE